MKITLELSEADCAALLNILCSGSGYQPFEYHLRDKLRQMLYGAASMTIISQAKEKTK